MSECFTEENSFQSAAVFSEGDFNVLIFKVAGLQGVDLKPLHIYFFTFTMVHVVCINYALRGS